MRGEMEMETPKKEGRFLDVFYDVTHDTFCISVSLLNGGISNEYLWPCEAASKV